CFFFSSRRRHTRSKRDWSSDVCSSDLRDARVDALLYRGFAHAEFGKIDETPRAKIFHERQSASLAEGNEFFNRRLIGKTGDLEEIGRASCGKEVVGMEMGGTRWKE